MQWFEVDKAGLKKLLGRRGKAAVLLELLQNAWDQEVTRVDVQIVKPRGSRCVKITVEDDDPEGFADLSDAFTLFAPSAKKSEPEKRGRFNLGEKLVLALCERAEIRTTKGTLRFDASGRTRTRRRTRAGTVFSAELPMATRELDETLVTLRRVISQPGVTTRINGEALPSRESVARFALSLPTEIADTDGYLRSATRKTLVEVYTPFEGEEPTLFEMGIPVVATGDRFHVNVGQKVPLSMERDNVRPSYLRHIRTAVVNAMAEMLGDEDWNAPWVREALSDERIESAAAQAVIRGRFGEKAVAYDASDPEANKRAIAKGYQVVHGGQMSKAEWAAVRKIGALPPAGQVTPSPRVFSTDPDAKSLKMVAPDSWNEAERSRIALVRRLAERLLGERIDVTLASDPHWPFGACYGSNQLILNRGKLGRAWFDGPVDERVLSLVLHELAHHYEGDHLSSAYHEPICRLGARLALAVQGDPKLLESA